MTSLWIDTRWQGPHGIGRYAREVCSRLTLPWRPLELEGSPASPSSAVARVPGGLVYSPGYNAFLRAERQVLTVHDLIHLHTPWPGRAKYLAYYNAVVKPTVKRSGVVITVSETSRFAIADWLKDPAVDIVNAGIGASPAFHRDVAPALASDPYLIYVGNLRPHKNLRVVLDAMTHLPEARLRLLLPKQEHQRARSLLRARNLESRVELLEPLPDEKLASHYRGAAALLMPSTVEGFGLPPLESIMTGTAVIYWRGCESIAETVGDRGWIVDDAHDAEEWANAMRVALASHRRVTPPSPAHDWDATAMLVQRTLARCL